MTHRYVEIISKINKCKSMLDSTDYIDNKLTEALCECIVNANREKLVAVYIEYQEVLKQRQAWRDEINSLEEELKAMGYEVEWFGFTDTNDVASVTTSATESVDVIYIPTDNTAAANTEAIANILIPAKIPAVVGEEGICSGCGVATLSISYYDLGYKTGEMAADVLANGADITTMKVEYAPQVTKEYNAANVEALGITIPEDYVAIATE